MKYSVFIFSIVMSVISMSAQTNHKNQTLNDTLVSIAEEVSQTFGPDYHVNKDAVKISGPFVFHAEDSRKEISQNEGREYYMVSFENKDDETKEFMPYLSKIKIWKDSLQPQDVIFGNGFGRNFFFESYKEQKNKPFKTISR